MECQGINVMTKFESNHHEDSVAYKDGKIYYNGEHIGYIEFSFYEDIKALGFGNFEIIDKRKGYGTLVIKDIIYKYKNKYNLIYCFVDKDNIGAIEFYKKVGKVCFDIANDKCQYQVILYGKEDSVVLSREEYERFVELEKKSNRIVIDFAQIDRWLKDGIFCAVNKIKTELNEYLLNNEYFIENEPNGNLWQMNSSIFYLEVLDNGGLIDQITENHFKISEQEYSGIKEEIEQTRKETAEKILQMFEVWEDKPYVSKEDFKRSIADLFGVEIKE